MKIGLICPYNLFKGGGVQECVIALQAGLTKRGHEVFIITPQPREVPGEVEPHILFVGLSADVKSPFHTTAQISVNVNPEAVESILKEHKFDILHFHEPWVPIMSRQLLAKSESINIATFHAKLPETAVSRTVERVITPYTKSLLKNLDVLTAVSDPAAEYVSQLSKEKIHIIPNGIDLQKYQPQKHKSRSPTIIYVGRLEKRKGVKYLIQAFGRVQQKVPNAALWIVGDGVGRSKLENQVQQMRLKNVQFYGYVDELTKIQLLQKATVFCSPARFGESFGIVLLEAMALGIPVVAGDNPGYSSVLKERGLLSLINPLQTDEFARRLEVFLIDEKLRNLSREWGLSEVKRYSYEKIISSYESVYRQSWRTKDR